MRVEEGTGEQGGALGVGTLLGAVHQRVEVVFVIVMVAQTLLR